MSTIDEKKGLGGPELTRNSSGSFSDEKGDFGPDVVCCCSPPELFARFIRVFQAVFEADIMAVGSDIEEAIAASRNMSPEEVEEIINHMIREVSASSVLYHYYTTNSLRSTTKTPTSQQRSSVRSYAFLLFSAS
jgi:hypothetical protein